MDFILEFGIHEDLAKVSRLLVRGFFLGVKKIGWYGFSYAFLVVLNRFHKFFFSNY